MPVEVSTLCILVLCRVLWSLFKTWGWNRRLSLKTWFFLLLSHNYSSCLNYMVTKRSNVYLPCVCSWHLKALWINGIAWSSHRGELGFNPFPSLVFKPEKRACTIGSKNSLQPRTKHRVLCSLRMIWPLGVHCWLLIYYVSSFQLLNGCICGTRWAYTIMLFPYLILQAFLSQINKSWMSLPLYHGLLLFLETSIPLEYV